MKVQKSDFMSIFLASMTVLYYKYTCSMKSNLSKLQKSLNVTSNYNQSFVIFNQVPKTGSEQMMYIIDVLAPKNQFLNISSNPEFQKKKGQFQIFPDKAVRYFYVDMLQFYRLGTTFPRIVYKKNMHFLNFEEFNLTNPIFVSMVRNPLERIISWYYYHRLSWNLVLDGHYSNPIFYKESFEECVEAKREHCQFINETLVISEASEADSQKSQISYFCGHDLDCQYFGHEKALQLAMRNVDKYYSVVGILEEMQWTLPVLESFLPVYFSGASTIFEDLGKNAKINRNPVKPQVREDIKKMVAQNMSLEFAFYEFCKQRLYKQYLSLGK